MLKAKDAPMGQMKNTVSGIVSNYRSINDNYGIPRHQTVVLVLSSTGQEQRYEYLSFSLAGIEYT